MKARFVKVLVLLLFTLAISAIFSITDFGMSVLKQYVFSKCTITMSVPVSWETYPRVIDDSNVLLKVNTKDEIGNIYQILVLSEPLKEIVTDKENFNKESSVFIILPPLEGVFLKHSAYPKFGDSSLRRYGRVMVYLSESLKKGAIYLDEKTVLPLLIVQLPGNGYTSEFIATISSIRRIK